MSEELKHKDNGGDGIVGSQDIKNILAFYKSRDRQLDAILNTSTDGIWVCDGSGMILSINRASEEFNGIRAQNFIGKNITYAAEKGIFDRSATLETIRAGREVAIVQYMTKKKHFLMVTGTPTFDEDGKISLVIVTERDMTQLNAMRDQLEETRMATEKYRDELAERSISELKDHGIIAESRETKSTLRTALKLAHLNASNILILGESGTGKGLLAKLIHKNSKRRNNPFVQINCAALPESLLEAELFGYEKGAFTGAHTHGKIGLFELAHEGTLFLDEIGDLPLTLQAKLLKYLDDKEIIRLGGTKSKKIDCTILAATNRNLEELSASKQFREDLFFRLNAFVLHMPPLRERPEDVLSLAGYFLEKYNKSFNAKKRMTTEVCKALVSYPFPGNIRELENILKQAVVMCEGDTLNTHIIQRLRYDKGKTVKTSQRYASPCLNNQISVHEREILKAAMKKCRSTREMADYLGVSQSTVVRKVKKHNISYDMMQ
ncbi:MAG TPA: sigma 54-interacting transcriptional regulator [Syntrophales bacterium]|nr:sigma 54-interacting transcriptional regulator [Syntrophales bacterium]